MKRILGLILAIALITFNSNRAISQIKAFGNEMEEVMDSVRSSSKTVTCFVNSPYVQYNNRDFIFSNLPSNMPDHGDITYYSAEYIKRNVVDGKASGFDFDGNDYTINTSCKINSFASVAKQAVLIPINGIRKDLEDVTIKFFLSMIKEKMGR